MQFVSSAARSWAGSTDVQRHPRGVRREVGGGGVLPQVGQRGEGPSPSTVGASDILGMSSLAVSSPSPCLKQISKASLSLARIISQRVPFAGINSEDRSQEPIEMWEREMENT